MPSNHAVLPPSAAERWTSCPASVRLIAALPKEEETSFYAEEGTAAHALAEVEAGLEFGLIARDEYASAIKEVTERYGRYIDSDMHKYVELYLEAISEALAERPNSILMLEQKLDTGIPKCWGTSDAVIVSPTHVHVIDLKYGQGVRVSAVDNPQLRLYGVSALEAYGDLLGEVEDVTMTIFQPRVGNRSTTSMPAKLLREWRDSLIPVAEEALGPDARFGPSEEACRWCPVKGSCRAQMEYAVDQDFTRKPDFLTPEEIGDALRDIPAIKDWCKAVEDYALDLAYSQQTPIPGFKVVLRGGRRKFTDPAYTVQSLIERGYTAEQVANVGLKPMGTLDKLLTKEDTAYLEETGQMVKAPGSPALVKESAPGAPISPDTEAKKEFTTDEV